MGRSRLKGDRTFAIDVPIGYRALAGRYPINVTHFYMLGAMNTRFGIDVEWA
jgi:hypothetical protein